MRIIKVAQIKPEYMTVKAFRMRFTLEERIAIEEASVGSALVRVFLQDLATSLFVDRHDPQVLEGLQALEQAGLIAEGRAEEIQSAPVEDYERYSVS